MKNLVKALLVAVALAGSFLLVGTDVDAAVIKGTTIRYKEPVIKKVSDKQWASMYKGSKANSAKAVAKKMKSHLMKREKTFTITTNWKKLSLDAVFNAIGELDDKKTSDDADFIKGGILSIGWTGYLNSKGTMITTWKLVYTETASQVKKVNKSSKSVLKKLGVSKLSDIAKVKAIHDYVVELVTYDDSMQDYSAYGGLTADKHSTVCQGYSLIMYKLLTDAGVPCHYVTGDVGGPHAWNIVKINKKWYYLDSTWDDPSDTTVYDYFLIGESRLKKDHTTDKYYKQKFNISSKDLDWATLLEKSKNPEDEKIPVDQTDEEIENGRKALERESVIKELNSMLNETLGIDEDSEDSYDTLVKDACKKIYGFIVEKMSDEAFASFMDSDDMRRVFLSDTQKLINEYILDPITEYIDSDDYTDRLFDLLINDFDEDDLENFTEDSLAPIIEVYMYEDISNMLHDLTKEYSRFIVDSIVEQLNSMV